MKRRKLIVVLSCVILLLSTLTACGKENDVITDVSEAFRSILISEFNGSVTISRESGESVKAYAGLSLSDGDKIGVDANSELMLDVDSDKHLYAPELTKFWMEATGDESSSRTVIHLEEGCCLNRLTEKLSEGETYEVQTANATLSVRGTIFYVSRYVAEDGAEYILLEVMDGIVHVELIDPNHRTVEEADFTANEAGLVRADGSGSQFVLDDEVDDEYWMTDDPNPTKVYDGDGKPQLKLTPEKMPEGVFRQLEIYETEGDDISITPAQIKALLDTGHDFVEDSRVEPTCTEEGLVTSTCSICGEKQEETLAALGHDYVVSNTIAATCTKDGLQTHTCIRCGDSYDVTQAATGHNISVTNTATCTEPGEITSTCLNCGYSYGESSAALGHSYGAYSSNGDATCTEDGTKSAACTRCGNVITTSDTGSAKGHTSGTAAKENEIAATCTAEGSYESVVKCTVCGTEISRTPVTVAKLAHTVVNDTGFAASCTTAGLSDGSHCSVCNTILKAQETIPAKGHTEVTDNAVEATCTTTGLTAGSHCSVCNAVLVAQETIPALGHSLTETEEMAETCVEDGNSAYWTCSICGKYYSDAAGTTEIAEDSWIIAADGHSWETLELFFPEALTDDFCYTEQKICSICESETSENHPHVLEHNTGMVTQKDGAFHIVVSCTNSVGESEAPSLCSYYTTHVLTLHEDDTVIRDEPTGYYTCSCGERFDVNEIIISEIDIFEP